MRGRVSSAAAIRPVESARRTLFRRAIVWLAVIGFQALGLGSAATWARADAIFGDDVEVGGFGGPELRLSQMHGDLAVLLGAEGGWVLNHRWIVGGAGFALVNNLDVDFGEPNGSQRIELGYGGVCLQYAGNTESITHPVIGILIGGGGADFRTSGFFDLEDTGDSFFVLEPSIGLEVNLLEKVHLKLDGGYRWIAGADLPKLDDSDLSGASFGLGVRVGEF